MVSFGCVVLERARGGPDMKSDASFKVCGTSG